MLIVRLGKGMDHPIYVGKADPDDQAAKDAVSQGRKFDGPLYSSDLDNI